jgi:hypothetical protein
VLKYAAYQTKYLASEEPSPATAKDVDNIQPERSHANKSSLYILYRSKHRSVHALVLRTYCTLPPQSATLQPVPSYTHSTRADPFPSHFSSLPRPNICLPQVASLHRQNAHPGQRRSSCPISAKRTSRRLPTRARPHAFGPRHVLEYLLHGGETGHSCVFRWEVGALYVLCAAE